MKTYSIILGGGMGIRMKSSIPKCYFKLGTQTILDRTINIFEKSDLIHYIVVVVPKGQNVKHKTYKKVFKYVQGGATRGESIANAVAVIPDDDANIIIHDGCRPFLNPDIIKEGLAQLSNSDIVKTVKKPSEEVFCLNKKAIYTRDEYYVLSSPAFTTLGYIRKLLPFIKKCNCETISAYKTFKNPRVSYVETNRENIKITFPEDLVLARYFSSIINL